MPYQNQKPQPGDLIEFTYNGNQHWALYEGKGYVVHLVPKGDISLTNLLRWCSTGVVKRDRLQDVVRNNHYKVNNTLNIKCKVNNTLNIKCSSNLQWPKRKIFKTVKKIVGMEIKYQDLSTMSKCVVEYLRYGLYVNEEFCEPPQPGDLIEIFRNGYQHWTVFEGDGYVIHLAPPPLNMTRSQKTAAPTAVVQRDLLRNVAKNCVYRVNNHLDDKYSLLPVDKILSPKRSKIGKEMKMEFHFWKKKCEAFVTHLRYGLISPDPFCDRPKPGDMIEIFHTVMKDWPQSDLFGPHYRHWAIYEGDGYVIHLSLPDGFFENENTLVSAALGLAVVKRQLLNDVVEDCPYRINNYLDNSCPPKPLEDILSDAKKAVDKSMDYSLLYWNCEHFVTCLRNKFAFSAQAEYFLRRLQCKNADEISEIVRPVCEQVLKHSLTTYSTYNACNGICR